MKCLVCCFDSVRARWICGDCYSGGVIDAFRLMMDGRNRFEQSILNATTPVERFQSELKKNHLLSSLAQLRKQIELESIRTAIQSDNLVKLRESVKNRRIKLESFRKSSITAYPLAENEQVRQVELKLSFSQRSLIRQLLLENRDLSALVFCRASSHRQLIGVWELLRVVSAYVCSDSLPFPVGYYNYNNSAISRFPIEHSSRVISLGYGRMGCNALLLPIPELSSSPSSGDDNTRRKHKKSNGFQRVLLNACINFDLAHILALITGHDVPIEQALDTFSLLDKLLTALRCIGITEHSTPIQLSNTRLNPVLFEFPDLLKLQLGSRLMQFIDSGPVELVALLNEGDRLLVSHSRHASSQQSSANQTLDEQDWNII